MGHPPFRPTVIPVTIALCCLATLVATEGTRCLDDITKTTDDGKSTSSTATWTVSGLSCGRTSGSDFPIGITTVTCTQQGQDGSKTACTFRVIIKDDEPPTVTNCPLSQRKFVPDFSPRSEVAESVIWHTPPANDNSGSEWFAKPSPSHQSGSVFPLGDTHVVYTARDYSGNVNTDCDFHVRVVVQPWENHTFVSGRTADSITVLFPQMGDSIQSYYTLFYQDKSTRDASFGSRTSFSVTNNDQTFIEQAVEGLSPGQLYFIEVGIDESGSQGNISTSQHYTTPTLDAPIEFSSANYSSVLIDFQPGISSVEQYRVSVTGSYQYLSYLRNDTQQVVVGGLVPGSGWFARVTAVVGSGEMRVFGETKSQGGTLDNVPENQLIAYNYTEWSISVAWRGVVNTVGGQTEPYMLFIYSEGGSERPQDAYVPIFDEGQGTKTAEFKGLQPNTLYHVRLVSNRKGLAMHLNQTTRPMRVSNLRPTEVLDDSITLEWDPVSRDGNAGYTYEVTISPKPGSDYEITAASNTRTIGSLVNGTEYFFTVMSIVNGTKSVPQTLIVTAGVSVASSTSNLEAIAIGIGLGLFDLALVLILFIVCRKYRNLEAAPSTTGQTNYAVEDGNRYAGHLADDSEGNYEAPQPVPQPAPQPVPQPVPQPMPMPMPMPLPKTKTKPKPKTKTKTTPETTPETTPKTTHQSTTPEYENTEIGSRFGKRAGKR